MTENLFELNVEHIFINKTKCHLDYFKLYNRYPNSKPSYVNISDVSEFIKDIDIALKLSTEENISIVEPYSEKVFDLYPIWDKDGFEIMKKKALENHNIIYSFSPIKYIESTNYYSIGTEDDFNLFFNDLSVSKSDLIKLKEYFLSVEKKHPYFKKKKTYK